MRLKYILLNLEVDSAYHASQFIEVIPVLIRNKILHNQISHFEICRAIVIVSLSRGI